MEKKFYPDNFERLLKESADNFRMYPSKKVWHGIYNDLHPSRRWPSLVIWILLIFSGIYIGSSNGSRIANTETNKTGLTSATKPSDNSLPIHLAQYTGDTHNNPGLIEVAGAQKNSGSSVQTTGRTNNQTSTPVGVSNSNGNNAKIQGKRVASNIAAAVADEDQLSTSVANAAISINTVTADEDEQAVSTTVINNDTENKDSQSGIDLTVKKPETEPAKKIAVKPDSKNPDKEWIEDFAFHNKPLLSKWKSRISHQLYMTPSIGYRILARKTNYEPVATPLVVDPAINNRRNYKDDLSHAAAVNVELGGNFLYSLTKNWNLKAGIQLNYTNYGINAYELKHPTSTTLLLNDLTNGQTILDPRSTSLANTSGESSKRLNNNTYQVSLPLGADIKLAGKNNLKWYAGATIQPTYVIGGHSYLISSDLQNYVTDNSFIRNWNLNAGFETFISYKTQGGIIVNAGPQFRYQLLSTYSKEYTYSEKLYNIGLKIGITTRF